MGVYLHNFRLHNGSVNYIFGHIVQRQMKRDKNWYKKVRVLYPNCLWHLKEEAKEIPSTQSHHIISKGIGGGWGEDKIENGVGLCMECHNEIHAGHRKLRESWLPEKTIEYVIHKKWHGWNKIIWDRTGE